MSVKLLFFAQCAEWVGLGELNLPIKKAETLESLLKASPLLQSILKNRRMVRVAVNQKLTGFNAEIKDNDEIAFLPPYSGG